VTSGPQVRKVPPRHPPRSAIPESLELISGRSLCDLAAGQFSTCGQQAPTRTWHNARICGQRPVCPGTISKRILPPITNAIATGNGNLVSRDELYSWDTLQIAPGINIATLFGRPTDASVDRSGYHVRDALSFSSSFTLFLIRNSPYRVHCVSAVECCWWSLPVNNMLASGAMPRSDEVAVIFCSTGQTQRQNANFSADRVGDWERRGEDGSLRSLPLEHFSRRKVPKQNRSAAPCVTRAVERGMFNRTCTRSSPTSNKRRWQTGRGAVTHRDDEATHKNETGANSVPTEAMPSVAKSDALYVPPAGKYSASPLPIAPDRGNRRFLSPSYLTEIRVNVLGEKVIVKVNRKRRTATMRSSHCRNTTMQREGPVTKIEERKQDDPAQERKQQRENPSDPGSKSLDSPHIHQPGRSNNAVC